MYTEDHKNNFGGGILDWFNTGGLQHPTRGIWFEHLGDPDIVVLTCLFVGTGIRGIVYKNTLFHVTEN